MVTATTTEQHTDSESQQSFHFWLNFKLLVQFSLEWFLYKTSCWELALHIWQFICIIMRDHTEIFSSAFLEWNHLNDNTSVQLYSKGCKSTKVHVSPLSRPWLRDDLFPSFIHFLLHTCSWLSLSLSEYAHCSTQHPWNVWGRAKALKFGTHIDMNCP